MKRNFWSVLLVLAATSILLKLGFWQLDRAEQKQQALAKLADQEVLTLAAWREQRVKQDLHSRKIRLTGNVKKDRVWLLDNRMYQGQVGYSVITLFEAAGVPSPLLVDWGWVKAESSREQLPEVNLPSQITGVIGLIKTQDFAQLVLKDTSETGWPRRIQSLQQLDLSKGIIYADSESATGLVQAYEPVVMLPEKHQAYAVQWFGLAIACLLVFAFASRPKAVIEE